MATPATFVKPEPPTGWRRVVFIALAIVAGLVVVGGLVVFAAGEDLFGSDTNSIDSYNHEVLASCEVPPDSTLVRTYVLPVVNFAGDPFRSMSYIYASPLEADQLAEFYQLPRPREWGRIGQDRACRFGNRPTALVISFADAGQRSDQVEEFWAAEGALEIKDRNDPPADTVSLVLLRLAQRETQGFFD